MTNKKERSFNEEEGPFFFSYYRETFFSDS